jgi:hypothetical protein
MRRPYEVKLFILGCPVTEHNTRVEIINAESQEEAEEKAHDWYVSDGWGVLGSRPILSNGDIVTWNDPAIDDYDEKDREYARGRLFEIVSDVDGRVRAKSSKFPRLEVELLRKSLHTNSN